MKTPIADANRLEIWTEPYTEAPSSDGDFVRFEIARRLELDRAALMAILSKALDYRDHEYVPNALFEQAEQVLSAARANFPES